MANELDRAEQKVEDPQRSSLKGAWPARPQQLTQILVYCRLKLGWDGGKARAITSLLLAACYLTFLHSPGGGRNLLKSPHAA